MQTVVIQKPFLVEESLRRVCTQTLVYTQKINHITYIYSFKTDTKSKDTHSSNKMQNHRPRPTTPLSCAISEDDNTIESNSAAHLSSSGCSLTDSLGMLGMSPTAVLSHLSLASPRKAVPRFRSRNNSFSSENNSYNANGNNSTPTTPTAPISPSTPPFDKILLPNIPNNDHRNTNHNTDGQNGTTNHADTTNINGTTHKRSHSPKDTEENGYKEEEEGEREEEEEEDDCECDDEDSEFEFEEAGPSLSENIQTYLKGFYHLYLYLLFTIYYLFCLFFPVYHLFIMLVSIN